MDFDKYRWFLISKEPTDLGLEMTPFVPIDNRDFDELRGHIFMSDLKNRRTDWIVKIMDIDTKCVNQSCWQAYSRYISEMQEKKIGRPKITRNFSAMNKLAIAYNDLLPNSRKKRAGTTAERISSGELKEFDILIENCFGYKGASPSSIRKVVDSINQMGRKAIPPTIATFTEPSPGKDAPDSEHLEWSRRMHNHYKK